jgi:hypothetical protein
VSPITPAREAFLYSDGDRRLSMMSVGDLHFPVPPPPYTSNAQKASSPIQEQGEGTEHLRICKVLQSFDPLFHDEMSVRAGETLTVNKTFTDGWCVVGRLAPGLEDTVGVVPLWCFQEPSGYRPMRPTRSKSLRKERKFSHPWARR